MPAVELQSWREFYLLYPFDDVHRYHRPAAMVAAAHPEVKDQAAAIRKRLEWLQPPPLVPAFGDADLRTIAALGGTPPPQFMKARET
jgi:hypothetical protein